VVVVVLVAVVVVVVVLVVVAAATVAPTAQSVPSTVMVILDLPIFLLRMTASPFGVWCITNHLIRALAFVCDACKLHSVILVRSVLLPKPSPLGFHGFMS